MRPATTRSANLGDVSAGGNVHVNSDTTKHYGIIVNNNLAATKEILQGLDRIYDAVQREEGERASRSASSFTSLNPAQDIQAQQERLAGREIEIRRGPPRSQPQSSETEDQDAPSSFLPTAALEPSDASLVAAVQEELVALEQFWEGEIIPQQAQALRRNLDLLKGVDQWDHIARDALYLVQRGIRAMYPPRYTIIPRHTDEEGLQKIRSERRSFLGLYLEFLHASPDFKSTTTGNYHAKILLLSVSDVGSQDAISDWARDLEHRGLGCRSNFSLRSIKTTTISDAHVFEQITNSRRAVGSIVVKTVDAAKGWKDIKQDLEDEHIFTVLCFKIQEFSDLEALHYEWANPGGRAPRLGISPKIDAVVGFSPQTEAVRGRRISRPAASRGQARDVAQELGAKMYFECARDNGPARDLLFSALVGASVARGNRSSVTVDTHQ